MFSTGGTDLLDNDTVEDIRLGERDPLSLRDQRQGSTEFRPTDMKAA